MRIFRHIMPVFLAIYFKSTQFADCCTKKVCFILCFASFLQKASTVTRVHLFCRKQKSGIVGRPELLEGIGDPMLAWGAWKNYAFHAIEKLASVIWSQSAGFI